MIIENKERECNFTSSKIFHLTKPGKGENGFCATALSYIEEKNLERKLGRSIDTGAYSRDMAWGVFLEKRVFDKLEYGYELVSNKTVMHPSIKYWSGSTDLIFPLKKIGEIKCYQPKNFAKYTDVLLQKDIELLKTEFPQEYWQMVSNSIINKVPNAEAISYMPYQSELPEIREMAEYLDSPDQWKYRFIAESEDSSLAYLPDNGYYKNLNRFEFEVPQEDKDFLTERVLLAGSMLINPVMLATHDEEVNATIVEQILKPSIID
jgi:hypothetical protein